MATHIGFKKLFVEDILGEHPGLYNEITEEFENNIRELIRFDYYSVSKAFVSSVDANENLSIFNPLGVFDTFIRHLRKRILSLQLEKEMHLIAECGLF